MAKTHVNIGTETVRKHSKSQLVGPLGTQRESFALSSSPKVGHQTNRGLLSLGNLRCPIPKGEPPCQRAMSI